MFRNGRRTGRIEERVDDMAVKVRIPTPLRAMTNGVDVAEIGGANVGEVLVALVNKYEGMDKRLFKQPGELNRFVNIYVNDEDIRFLDNLNTAVKDGDDLSIVPAIAGG
jgi:molybdopterin synthase sulfur carrier subunit